MALFGKKENEKKPPVVESPATPKAKATPTKERPSVTTQETTYFGKNLKITGNVSGQGNSIILGSFEGELDLKGQLKVARSARIKGSLKGTDIYVDGHVEGTITASEKIHIDNTARIKGSMETPKISIQEGCVFDGEILMSSKPAEITKPATPEKKQSSPAPAASDKK